MFSGVIPTIVALIGVPLIGFFILVIALGILTSFAIAGTAYLIVYLVVRYTPRRMRASAREASVYKPEDGPLPLPEVFEIRTAEEAVPIRRTSWWRRLWPW